MDRLRPDHEHAADHGSGAETCEIHPDEIQNQVQQIQTLTDQLNEFKHYESLFGDPKAVLLSTVQPLIGDLKKTELGQTLTALEGAVDAGEAMLYDANGLFPASARRSTPPNGFNGYAPRSARISRSPPCKKPRITTCPFRPMPPRAAVRVEKSNRRDNRTTQVGPPTPRCKKTTRRSHRVDRRAEQHRLRNQSGHHVRAGAGHRQPQRRPAQIEAKKEQQHAEFNRGRAEIRTDVPPDELATAFPTP